MSRNQPSGEVKPAWRSPTGNGAALAGEFRRQESKRAGAAVTLVVKKARLERLVRVSILDSILISLFDLDVLPQIVCGDVRRVDGARVVRRNA
jgi:hypothetical protein